MMRLFLLALTALPLCLAAAGFSGGLTADQAKASGISRLDASQLRVLDALVSRDLLLAREGGVTGFASTFSSRHAGDEAKASGIALLTGGERAQLDRLVADALAAPPDPAAAFSYRPSSNPGMVPVTVSSPPKPEVHGDVAVTVGAGSHGSSFFGTQADLWLTDPSGKWTLGVGVSQFKAKGPWTPCLLEAMGPPLLP
jgi:hypothetical protein